MDVVLITEEKNPVWEKVIRKHISDCRLNIYDRNFDKDFGDYDLSVIDVAHPILLEDSIKDGIPTLCTTLPDKNHDKMEELTEVAAYTQAPFVFSSPFVFSPTYHHMMEAVGSIGTVKHINISFSDPDANKNEDVVWTVGYEMFCSLYGLLETLENYTDIDGWGLQGAGFYNSNLNNWITASFFVHEENVIDSSANIYISNIEDKGKKICVVGTEGRVEAFPLEKEVYLTDKKGRVTTSMDTGLWSWEEHQFNFMLEHLNDTRIHGQIGEYALFMCNEILDSLSEQGEHINQS